MKILASLIFVVFVLLTHVGSTFAADVPSFTSCLNPKGDVKASYETGTHGIAGKQGLFEGKDVVYKVSEAAITQCFCPTNGSAVQTNFWKIPVLSESEIKTFEAQGWIYIPNGALWGLDNAPFLAKNSDYSCKSSGGGGGGGGIGGSGNVSGSGSSGSGGSVSGSGGIGQVLGLASTGNTMFVLATALTSGISLLLGLIFKKRSKNISK